MSDRPPCVGRPRSPHVFLDPRSLPPPTLQGLPFFNVRYVTDPGRDPKPLTSDQMEVLESFGSMLPIEAYAHRLAIDGEHNDPNCRTGLTGNVATALKNRASWAKRVKEANDLTVDLGENPTYRAFCDSGDSTYVYVLNLVTREWELERIDYCG